MEISQMLLSRICSFLWWRGLWGSYGCFTSINCCQSAFSRKEWETFQQKERFSTENVLELKSAPKKASLSSFRQEILRESLKWLKVSPSKDVEQALNPVVPIYLIWSQTNLHVSFTELPSGTMTSDDVSSGMKSGGITTSRYPIWRGVHRVEH